MGQRLKICSSIPGRIRWQVPSLEDNSALARRIEATLGDVSWLTSFKVNPVTGRVLVQFDPADPEADAGGVETGILQCLEPGEAGSNGSRKKSGVPWNALLLEAAFFLIPIPFLPRPSLKMALAGAGLTVGVRAAPKLIPMLSRRLFNKGGTARAGDAAPGGELSESGVPASDYDPWPSVKEHLEPYRNKINLASTYSLVNKVFDLLPPVILGVGFNVLLGRPSSLLTRMKIVGKRSQLLAIGAASLGTWMLDAAFEYLQRLAWRDIGQRVRHDLRSRAYAHAQTLDVEYWENHPPGRIEDAIKGDVEELGKFIDSGPNTVIQTTAGMALVCTFFAVQAPGIAILSLSSIPVILLASKYLQERASPRYEAMRQQRIDYSQRLGSNIRGMRVIKNFTAEEHESELIDDKSWELVDKNRELDRISESFSPVIRTVVALNYTATFILGGLFTINGRLTPGLYSSIMFMSQRLLWPLTNLGRIADSAQRASTSLRRLDELFSLEATIRSGGVVVPSADIQGDIKFDNVFFSYDSKAVVIKGVSLHFEAGKTTALVGPTGSGKTSLMKLILRFYDPDAGTISLDGRLLTEFDLASLRHAVGLVSQDVILFHGTIRENITFGMPYVSEEAVVAAATTARAHDFIQALPDGYDTHVGESGVRLSGGQSQRVSIARAILRKSPVLILDEATSAFDRHTELELYEGLEKLTHAKTRIVIAHRLFSIQNADRIYVIENGTICEEGTHQSLLRRDGLYNSMWKAQNRPPSL